MRNDLMAAVDRLQESYKRMTIFGCLDDDDARYMDALVTALTALREKQQRQPDPDTGLLPCGCGGKAKIWSSDLTQFTHVITDYEVGCTECAMTTGWVRGKQENAMNVWNTAMGWKGGSK